MFKELAVASVLLSRTETDLGEVHVPPSPLPSCLHKCCACFCKSWFPSLWSGYPHRFWNLLWYIFFTKWPPLLSFSQSCWDFPQGGKLGWRPSPQAPFPGSAMDLQSCGTSLLTRLALSRWEYSFQGIESDHSWNRTPGEPCFSFFLLSYSLCSTIIPLGSA